jgi:3',5'-cyclic AMP phosphodiesterase CpdA
VSTTPKRVVVHLSDLHFGREDRAVVAALTDEMARLAPDLVAVSGDLTQRARRAQFRKARAFLDALPFPRLVVPGNHDVPLFNIVARMTNPLGGYRRYITSDLQPLFVDPMLVVVGMDTTRPSTLKAGRIPYEELARVQGVLRHADEHAVKIFVGHHPFDLPEDVPGGVRRPSAVRSAAAESALEALTRAGVDAFLTGHLHVSYTGHTAHRYNIGGRSAIVVEAGTATSTRLRENANSFNVLHIEPAAITVKRHEWQATGFVVIDSQRFERTATGWTV